MSAQIRLIHPIYLDVPMLVSFAAALEGGVSLTSEVVNERSSSATNEKATGWRLGIGSLFSKFFDASVDRRSSREDSEGEISRTTESRGHTEASLAILLYDRLSRDVGQIVRPRTTDELQQLEPGALVELSGMIEKNAVDTVIDMSDAIDIFTSLPQPQGLPAHSGGAKHRGGGTSSQQSPLRAFRDLLDRDRKRTPISNQLLRCSDPKGCTAVVTLRTSSLRDLTLSELHRNSVRVLGKVTRTVPTGETMSAFENYGLALLSPAKLAEGFRMMSTIPDFKVDFSEVEVHGPTVQILPLMVFV